MPHTLEHRRHLWKMTAIGVAIAGVSALVTGLVVAHRTAVRDEGARVESPSASPATTDTRTSAVTRTAPVAHPPSPATPAATESRTPTATDAPRRTGTPPASVTVACNKQAEAAGGGPPEANKPAGEALKDGAIGALGGAAVGALGGALADGGKGAGKGALIGGAVGAGGGSLYGIYKSRKNDERYRAAYASCMRERGYTS